MARGAGAICLGGRSDGFGLKFRSPEEVRGVQRPKHRERGIDESKSKQCK